MEGRLQPSPPASNCPAGATFSQHGLRKSVGRYRAMKEPVKFTETPGPAPTPAPTFGQHSDEILAGCGYSADEITGFLRPSRRRSYPITLQGKMHAARQPVRCRSSATQAKQVDVLVVGAGF